MLMNESDKQQLLERIMHAAENEIYYHLSDGVPMHYVVSKTRTAIAEAVRAGFRTLLDNVYTNDQFEQDINLK